jgi:hypothetical protein
MSPHSGVPVTEGMLQPFSHGVGYQDFIPLTTPAAGANLSFTVAGDRFIRILGARATITTSATVANRFVSLDFINARAQTWMRNAAGLVVTASTTNQAFEWIGQRTDAQWAANTPVLLPVYPIFLYPGMVVQITLDSIQAADQISLASLTVERFDTGDVGYKVGFVGGERGVLKHDG